MLKQCSVNEYFQKASADLPTYLREPLLASGPQFAKRGLRMLTNNYTFNLFIFLILNLIIAKTYQL